MVCGVVSGCRVSCIINISVGYLIEIKLKVDGKVDGIGVVCCFVVYVLKINIRFGVGLVVFGQCFNIDGIIGKDGEIWFDIKG